MKNKADNNSKSKENEGLNIHIQSDEGLWGIFLELLPGMRLHVHKDDFLGGRLCGAQRVLDLQKDVGADGARRAFREKSSIA